jgi:hypothetical protein
LHRNQMWPNRRDAVSQARPQAARIVRNSVAMNCCSSAVN